MGLKATRTIHPDAKFSKDEFKKEVYVLMSSFEIQSAHLLSPSYRTYFLVLNAQASGGALMRCDSRR